MNSRVASLGVVLAIAAAAAGVFGQDAHAQPEAAVIENTLVRYEIGPEGQNLRFIDKATGTDYCKHAEPDPVAQIKKAGAVHAVTGATYADGRLTLDFAEADARVIVAVEIRDRSFVFTVEDVAGEDIEEITFLHLPLDIKGRLDEPFAACALALNLQTNVPEIPGPNALLRAMCHTRFGFTGAKAAVIACPQAQLRDIMKEVVSAAEELPRSDIGGPWALDAPGNRGSYLFDFGQCTEATVDEWVALAKQLGMNQIDFHTGHSLRFGDCRPHPDLFPNGRASVKAVIDRLHEAGIAAGLHTYAFFLAKDTPYVTPVPDPRLGKFATFTLAAPIDAEATSVPVTESTGNISTITGFFVRNSVTVQIDDELITFAGAAKEAPYAFTQCARGAYGTTPAPHAEGAKVHHLRECFGLFTPDADSTLLAEVAANTADTFNECGFDMIYLDALDGEDVLAGHEYSWHYGSKFVFEIANRLQKPALFEMSTFHHHLWYVRARMGAWDHPVRSHKQFIDIHLAANQQGARMFLPMNLGWWSVKVWSNPRSEPTFTDDTEYLMCRCLGADMGISLMGVNPGNIGNVPAYQRLAPIYRQYEELRHAQYFPDSVKKRLIEPGKEFTLEQNAEGNWQFREMHYAKHKVCGLDGWSNVWTTANPFAAQPVALRIEALAGAAPYDSPDAVVVEDFADPTAVYTQIETRQGVETALTRVTDPVRTGEASGCFTAISQFDQPRGAWAKIGKVYEPALDLTNREALGVWVHGDGQGELLNLRMMSPSHLSHGIGDRYITVDFTGWRYFELIETEGAAIDAWGWPYGGHYAVYREDLTFNAIESFALWYNNLPVGKPVTCHIGPVKALPVMPVALRNPRITVNGQTVTFPCEVTTGSYIEFRGMADCKLYGPNGELVAEIVPQGGAPEAIQGDNAAEFACDAVDGPNPRARVTVITRGEVI